MEAGFARMNGLVVIQTTQGIAEYLRKRTGNLRKLKAVVGFDGRRHSRRFAELAAVTFLAKDFEVIWFQEVVHTPLVPFAVRTGKADVGVMVTASHNPKDDNGYKVYGANGCQINTPEDRTIALTILENLSPLTWDTTMVRALPNSLDEIREDYIDQIAANIQLERDFPSVVYTPMHGVGLDAFIRTVSRLMPHLFEEFKGDDVAEMEERLQAHVRVVSRQANPDPEFPTVTYPNPEEHGALDLAKAEADEHGFRIVIASDPDADRFAAAQKLDDGTWYQFKGDEMGALLGYHIWTKHKAKPAQDQDPLMIVSAVSSQMLAEIGKQEGFEVQETLTGFKWIGGEAVKAGTRTLFGYEEALGYMLPGIVHDKDGISAACLFLEACSHWKQLPYGVLQDLYKKYGYFKTVNTYWKSPSVQFTKSVFDRIQADPTSILPCFDSPTDCRVRDATAGSDSGTKDGRSSLPIISENLMITLWLSKNPALQEGVRLTVRASGTEPKIKGQTPKTLTNQLTSVTVYIECHSRISSTEAENGALLALRTVRHVWFVDKRLQMESKYADVT